MSTLKDFAFIGFCLEGFFYGIYSAIFAMYLQYHCSKHSTDYRRTSIIFYSLCTLYVLSTVQFASDLTFDFLPTEATIWTYNLYMIQVVISGCCDFIPQSILIYRCWIVWNRNIHIVIIPSILSFIFLGLWVADRGATASNALVGRISAAKWGITLAQTSLAISLTVNALMTSLIMLKIFKVYSEVKSYSQAIGPSSAGSKLRPILFIIIESGLILFAIQLARLVIILVWTDAATKATDCIVGIHEMLNGITPTIIQVRVSMGLSFHDEPSLEEVISGLHFVSDQGNSISGTGSDGTQCLGSNYIVDVQPSNDEVERDGDTIQKAEKY